jgi:NAD(P)-dependent dehydrogenase (short-subunit alcohol dehydrogenase family)
MSKLEGKIAIITGGASGIGEAAVRKFVAEGATVVIADLQEEKAQALVHALDGRAVFQLTDVASEADVQHLVEATVQRFGRLDCFYNNAGFGCAIRSIAETPLAEFESQIAVLLRGTFLGIKHAAGVMKRQKSGTIVNTSSVAALAGGYSNHVYSAAKAGVISLTRSTALELGESGIRVNCICPGNISTPIFVGGIPLTPVEVQQALGTIAAALSHNPLARSGTPEEVASVALWLASDDSAYVTGQSIVIDGGMTSGLMWTDMQAWLGGLYGNLCKQFPAAFAKLAAKESVNLAPKTNTPRRGV